MSAIELTELRPSFRAELGKLPAFFERDMLTAWSYRASLVTDAVAIGAQVLVFYFVGRLVDPSRLPAYGGQSTTYLQWAAIGIALGMFIHFALERVASAVRNEQLMGTLESVFVTPTSTATFQVGSVTFDLIYLPLRTAALLGGIALAFGLHFHASGIAPALVLLFAFVPFVWGLGLICAAAVVTFRRGGNAIAFAGVFIGLLSGVYFPTTLLPDWLATTTDGNPVAQAIEGMRSALIGGEGFTHIASPLLAIVPTAAASIVLGAVLFRLALRRERRLGTIGLY